MLTEAPPPARGGAQLMVTPNVDHIVQRSRNPDFAAAYRAAFLVTADGMPVYLFAKLRGANVAGRVTGADILAEMMPRLDPRLHRPFFVTCTEDLAEALKDYLCERGFDRDQVGSASPGIGFEKNAGQSEALAAEIRHFRPTHLVFGLGAPKSEIWIYQHRSDLGDCYALSVGAAAEYFIGARKRAPKLCRAAGLEWVWRLASEPQRLWKRYLVASWMFLGIVAQELYQHAPLGALVFRRLQQARS